MKRLLALAALTVLVACGSPGTTTRHDPDLRSDGTESPVAATVPGGSEILPVWQRTPDGGQATLVVPADLLFAKDSSALSPAAATVLQPVVAEFAPGKHVLVEGHADGDGEPSYNRALSQRRATAVAEWLAAAGVPRAAIETKGWGEDRPAVSEVDEAAKAQNRRVVVTVTAPTTAPVVARKRSPGRLRAAPRSDDPPTATSATTRRNPS